MPDRGVFLHAYKARHALVVESVSARAIYSRQVGKGSVIVAPAIGVAVAAGSTIFTAQNLQEGRLKAAGIILVDDIEGIRLIK